MPASTDRFSRSDRLLNPRDFRRVSRMGRRSASRCFVLLTTPRLGSADQQIAAASRSRSLSRLGITASRKVGRAVTRNYLKRGIREWFRHERAQFEEAVDVVVIARRQAADLTAIEVRQVLTKLMLKRVGGK